MCILCSNHITTYTYVCDGVLVSLLIFLLLQAPTLGVSQLHWVMLASTQHVYSLCLHLLHYCSYTGEPLQFGTHAGSIHQLDIQNANIDTDCVFIADSLYFLASLTLLFLQGFHRATPASQQCMPVQDILCSNNKPHTHMSVVS